ncbi:transcriptional regulator, LysR family [Yoonia tamlensis]|uniref:Transcriptional regulator, LysR family n=1 Tax=Yoonia tamlensis TaxID=390270 RepID=A0A1I6HV95_9RHOB|nr:LysR family transcriptional regulator [Yoonia tamlensis]SFR58369.1 transcriptional regulator, LysR family [Yoonia tamlensis]
MVNLLSFDLNLLRVLDALLHDPSTVRAARRLGLSQPAVSAALGRLRAALGDELFFRRGQGLAPTQFAQSLQAPLHEILAGIEALIQAPKPFDPAASEAQFRISGSDFFAEMLLPNLAEYLQVHAPMIRVHLVDLVSDTYVEHLDNYAIDLALIPDRDLPDWIASQQVFRSQYAVIARKDHPQFAQAGVAAGDVVPLDLYCDLGHVLFSPEGKNRAAADDALAQIGRDRRVVLTMPVFSGVYRAVAGSDLIALLPSALAAQVATSAGLVIYRPPIIVPDVKLMMIWNRRHSASAPHLWLRTQIAQLLAPLDPVL